MRKIGRTAMRRARLADLVHYQYEQGSFAEDAAIVTDTVDYQYDAGWDKDASMGVKLAVFSHGGSSIYSLDVPGVVFHGTPGEKRTWHYPDECAKSDEWIAVQP